MGDSFSVRAMLSAKDNGFSSTLKSALNSTKSLASEIKNGFAFGVLTGMGQQAFSTISGSVSSLAKEAISTSDAMQKLQQAMRFSGESEAEIERIAGMTGTLKTYADKTVFSLDDVMSTFGALSANGIKDADKMTESVGNAVAVFGGGAQEFSSVALAFSQSMAAGKMNAQDWNQVLNASPQLAGGLKKELIKLNPVLEKDFKGAMEDGAITADLLGKAMNNIGMTQMAKDAASSVSTMEGAMGNLEATVSSGIMTLYNSFAKSGLIDIINGFNDKIGTAFEWLSVNIPKAINKVKPYFTALKEAFSGVGSEVWGAVKEVGSALGELMGSFGSEKSVDGFKSTMQGVADFIKGIAGFVKDHAKEIATLIKWLPKIWIGIKAFNIAKTVAPGVMSFAKGVASIAFKGIGSLASKLFGISKAQKDVGDTSVKSGTKMMTSAKAFALMGLAVLAIAAGFALLAFSAIALANAGGGAIAVMAGMVVALVGLGVGMAFLLKFLASSGPTMLTAALSMLALGAAVLLLAAGLALLAVTAIALANSGGLAIGIMVGLIVVVALLAVVVAALGPALLIGAVGFLALGAGLILCGVGALLAATALLLLSLALPLLAQHGLKGSLAIVALGAALVVFAAGAALACIPLLVLGAAVLLVAAGVLILSAAALVTAVSLALLALVLPTIATNGSQAASAIALLGAGLLVFAVGAAVAGAAFVVLGAGLVVAAAGIVVFGAAMLVGAAGTIVMAAAIKAVNSSMKSIAKNAKSAEKSLKTMRSSVKAVQSGLDALGSKAKSAMNKLVSAFDNTASKAKSAGKKVGTGFTKGLQGGLETAPTVASQAVNQVIVTLNAGQASAFSAGAFISTGFAQGMLSCLGVIQSAASKMAAAADKAVRAKAKIKSPSRVAAKLGAYWGEGYVGGLGGMVKEAWRMAEELVAIPNVATPRVAMAYSGETVSDYDYYRTSDYTIEVPLTVDGKEFARATASYTQEELNKRQVRDSRKHGKV